MKMLMAAIVAAFVPLAASAQGGGASSTGTITARLGVRVSL